MPSANPAQTPRSPPITNARSHFPIAIGRKGPRGLTRATPRSPGSRRAAFLRPRQRRPQPRPDQLLRVVVQTARRGEELLDQPDAAPARKVGIDENVHSIEMPGEPLALFEQLVELVVAMRDRLRVVPDLSIHALDPLREQRPQLLEVAPGAHRGPRTHFGCRTTRR